MLSKEEKGRRIKAGLSRSGMSQKDLAEAVHVSEQAVSNWVKGKNHPDREIEEQIERVLKITLNSKRLFFKEAHKMNIPNLRDIENIEELSNYVDLIMENVEIESNYKTTLERILRDILVLALGYEIYYKEKESKWKKIDDWYPSWADVECYIHDLVDKEVLNICIPLESSTWPFRSKNIMKQQIELMTVSIGGELFEDFDEDGYRRGFIQLVGREAEGSGYDLERILSEKENGFSPVLNVAILNLASTLSLIEETYPDE